MRIVELILGDDELTGIEAISVVENPAIEEDFIALKSQEIKLAEVDKEKRILMGALLIPNKPILRRKGEEEYYIYFSRNKFMTDIILCFDYFALISLLCRSISLKI